MEFDLERKEYSTRNFSQIHELYQGKKKICTVASEPQSSALKKNLCLIKIENYLLYDPDIKLIVEQIIEILQVNFCGISRIDLANDFNKFDLNIYPENFIKRFLENKYLKKEKVKFKVIGEQRFKNVFDYIGFGSKTSEVNYYLYNKTKEMEQVKHKPHIYEKWKALELDLDKPVWRMEFSLKANKFTLVRNETGELIDLNSLDILDQTNLNSLYCALNDKYFVFVKNNGKSRKDRMHRVNLVNHKEKSNQLIKLSEKEESNRSDKIFIKKLFEYNQENRGNTLLDQITHNEHLEKFITSRNLERWVGIKHPAIANRVLLKNYKNTK